MLTFPPLEPGAEPGHRNHPDSQPRGRVTQPSVGIIMGSRSDRETMLEAARVLDELGIAYEMQVVSAHRTPDLMFRYAESAEGRGLRVIIAGAGGAAHLPGMTAAKTVLPVIGVPVLSSALGGVDSLLSIVQMPRGVPVATTAIGKAGAANAGLLAARILGTSDAELRGRLHAYAARLAEEALRPGPDTPAAP
jgi:5-(carboxyamino)imidazole ribonucleotide mutase